MKLIKLALISLFFLFVLATAIGALLPSNVLVSRAVNIAGSADKVHKQISDLQNWVNWVEGMKDSSVTIHSAQKATIGKNEVSINSISDTAVISSWVNSRGRPQISTIRLIYQPQQNLTIVQWQFEESVKWYPWEKLGSMMNDKILGTMMERNLEQLKNYLQAEKSNL